MAIYDTAREQKELSLLAKKFPDGLVYNPNRKYIQTHKNPMKACFQVVKDDAINCLAFSTNQRNRVSMGVYAEIRAAQKRGIIIYRITADDVQVFTRGFKITAKNKTKDWARIL
jgi:hypothetical protein